MHPHNGLLQSSINKRKKSQSKRAQLNGFLFSKQARDTFPTFIFHGGEQRTRNAPELTGHSLSRRCQNPVWFTLHLICWFDRSRTYTEYFRLSISEVLVIYLLKANTIAHSPPLAERALASWATNQFYFKEQFRGSWGIRTLGTVTSSSFQDWCNRPLCQTSLYFLAESIGIEPCV